MKPKLLQPNGRELATQNEDRDTKQIYNFHRKDSTKTQETPNSEYPNLTLSEAPSGANQPG